MPLGSPTSAHAAGLTALAFPCERPVPAESRYTDALLGPARARTDPLADRAVEVLVGRGRPSGNPGHAVRRLAAEGEPTCVALVEGFDATPEWLDFGRMRPGSEVSLRHVIPAGLALLSGSLIESYASARGVKVLVRTRRLMVQPYRRLVETMQFVSNLGVNRGPRPGTGSYDEALGVRLMHAWARRQAWASGDWDEAAWGRPVNQEDMLGTLALFSHVFRRALELQGIALTPAEHDAMHHCWRYTGYLLGIEEPLLPTSCAEEEALYLAVSWRHYAPDEDSRRLAETLLTEMAGKPPFFLPRAGLAALSRRMVGPRVADGLALPDSPGWRRLLDVAAGLNRAQQTVRDAVPGVRPLATRAGEAVVALTQRWGLPRRTEYALPEARGPIA